MNNRTVRAMRLLFYQFVNSTIKDWAIAFYLEVKRESKCFYIIYMFYPKL